MQCVNGTISGGRARYGQNIPFIAGTFSPSPGVYNITAPHAVILADALRYNFDPRGPGHRYGAPCKTNVCSPYYFTLLNSTMPVFQAPYLGLADSIYEVNSTGQLNNNTVPYDPTPGNGAQLRVALAQAGNCV